MPDDQKPGAKSKKSSADKKFIKIDFGVKIQDNSFSYTSNTGHGSG